MGVGSRVVEITMVGQREGESYRQEQMSAAVRRGLEILSGKSWRDYLAGIFGKRTRVSIKVNCLGIPGIPTRPELAYGFADVLVGAGMRKSDIIIWDRENDELRKGGYRMNFSASGVRCFGTDTLGVGYDRDLLVSGEVGSLPSRILTRMSDIIISMPVLKDHILAGYTGTMKNFFGAINNPNKYHMNNCSPYILDLFSSPEIKNRVPLSVLDGTFIQYHGGPSFNPRFRVEGRVLYLSEDPVAIDYAGYRKLEETRAARGLASLAEEKRFPQYILDGSKEPYRLGAAGEEVKIVKEAVRV